MVPALPFSILAAPARLPVLISVPHAGRAYSAALLEAVQVPASALAALEDPFVDRLVERAIAAGAQGIIAHAPRAEIDLNRSLRDLDSAMVVPPPRGSALSRRASVGLGLIPSRLAGHGPIWRRDLHASEVERRIASIHRPYHAAIADGLHTLRTRFGVATLIDCHSMPTRGRGGADIVLGDRHGTSADEHLVQAAEAACRAFGLTSARNDPYAGGEIVARHHRRAHGINALQIEIDRSLYLDDDLRRPGPGFERMSWFVATVVRSVAEAALADVALLAAE